MSIYTYIPQKNRKRTNALLIVLLSAAIGLLMFPALFPSMPLPWLFQASAFGCLAAMIFIVSRYIMKKTVYEILENDEGGMDFAVTEITNGGRTKITVCRFDIRSIEEIALLYRDNAEDAVRQRQLEGRARKEHRPTYNYCPDKLSTPVCCIMANEGVGPFFVKITPDRILYGYLTGNVDKATQE